MRSRVKNEGYTHPRFERALDLLLLFRTRDTAVYMCIHGIPSALRAHCVYYIASLFTRLQGFTNNIIPTVLVALYTNSDAHFKITP